MPPPPKSAIRHTTIVGAPVSDSETPDASMLNPDSKPDSKAKVKTTETVDSGYRPGHIARGLTKVYIQLGAIVKLLDPVMGDALIGNAKKCAESLDQLAKESPAVRRALESLLSTNAWVAVGIAHAPLFMALPPVRKNVLKGMSAMMGENSAEEFSTALLYEMSHGTSDAS